jgi:phosphohistidine phosphatase
MRHGEAKPEEEDPARPLTEVGRATVERIAARAARGDMRVDYLYHSGIRRARQTAEILARHLHAEDRLAPREGLRPLDPVEPVARWLLAEAALGQDRAVGLIGHMPFLDHLASRLVASDEAADVVVFVTGGLVKLVRKPRREGFAVAWVLPPELA